MKITPISIRRAGIAGVVLAVSATLLGAAPSGATETYKGGATLVSTRIVDYSQPVLTLQDRATARIGRVGITPRPIPGPG